MGWLGVLLLAQIAPYQDSRLEFDYVDAITAEDLNGDGAKDLIVQSGVELQIFLQSNRSYAAKPSYTIRMDDITFLWTLAAFGKTSYDLSSILAMSSRGIQRYVLQNNEYKRQDVVVYPTMFEGKCSAAKPPLNLNFAPDLNGDGLSDLLLFTKDSAMVFVQENGEFKLRQKLDLRLESTLSTWFGPHQRAREMTQVPSLAIGDANGDKRSDIIVYKDQAIEIFVQDAQGRFKSDGDVFPLVKRKHKPRRTYLQFEVPPRILDASGDGIIDIAVTSTSKGKVQMYYGAAGRADFTEPDEERQISDAWAGGTDFMDFDGDGRKELVMWIVPKLGIVSGIEAFVSKKVAIDLYFFKMTKDGRLEKQASQKLSFTIPFTLKLTRESGSAELIFEPNFEGDFTGDGVRDMIVMEGSRLDVYPGDRGAVLQSKPIGSIPFTPPQGTSFTKAVVTDLNADGRADVILKHVNLAEERAQLEIKVSK